LRSIHAEQGWRNHPSPEIKAQNNKEFLMSTLRRSKRFNPNNLTEKIVPAFLVMLVLVLLAVFIIIGLSLTGIILSV
jgi:hypothetical protein